MLELKKKLNYPSETEIMEEWMAMQKIGTIKE